MLAAQRAGGSPAAETGRAAQSQTGSRAGAEGRGDLKAEQGRRGRGRGHWEVPRKGREFQKTEQDVWSLLLLGRGRAGGQGGRGWSGG